MNKWSEINLVSENLDGNDQDDVMLSAMITGPSGEKLEIPGR